MKRLSAERLQEILVDLERMETGKRAALDVSFEEIKLLVREVLETRGPSLLDRFDLAPDEIEAVMQGHIIKAIKLVRRRCGLSLRDSKALVDGWRRKYGHS